MCSILNLRAAPVPLPDTCRAEPPPPPPPPWAHRSTAETRRQTRVHFVGASPRLCGGAHGSARLGSARLTPPLLSFLVTDGEKPLRPRAPLLLLRTNPTLSPAAQAGSAPHPHARPRTHFKDPSRDVTDRQRSGVMTSLCCAIKRNKTNAHLENIEVRVRDFSRKTYNIMWKK